MKLKNIIFCFLLLIILARISFAEPGIKITQPQDNSIVNPGQDIKVTVEAIEGFSPKLVRLGVSGTSNFFLQRFKNLPASFNVTIPRDSSGTIFVWAMAEDSSRNAVKDNITLKVQQTATLQSLEIDLDKIYINLDWDGNIKKEYDSGNIEPVYGVYSDGIKRRVPREQLIYTSSNPSVISVDNKGNYRVLKVGEATITVSYLGLSKIIRVVFEKPIGLPPKETMPPTIQIDIQPLANAAGWHNQDITITLTAQDNEGGSGIREIFYEFPYISAKSNDIADMQVVIPFSKEGVNLMRYGATDKEGNHTGQQTIEIRLDKTPPVVNINANLNILWPPDHKMINVKISGSATDNLSGVALTSFKVTDEYGKVEPVVSNFGDTIKLEASRDGKDLDGRTYTISVIAKDKAGNESRSSTTVICPHDEREQLSK